MKADSASTASQVSSGSVILFATSTATCDADRSAWQSHDEAGVSYTLHERENPLREETSTGPPLIAPA
jgi:hypothetical protein